MSKASHSGNVSGGPYPRGIQKNLRIAIERAAQGEFVRYDVEIYGRARGRETIIIDFSMIPVKDATGRVMYIVPEGRDITEKKAYEREIGRKNAELQALLERIRELDEIKTQFFANVSHELRTPLALIIGPAERLKRSSMDSSERREIADVIGRNARMLLKHVNDLLDISKLEAGKLKIEVREVDVAALTRFVASHFEVLAGERGIDYRLCADEEVNAAVDPEKLERVVMNLLSNAFKFVPDGGVVQCSLNELQGDIVIQVEDSGPGVEPKLREAIFERFRQAEGGTNRQFGGTGLGLAIAREFVELHHGKVQVRDSKLGGALFEIILPRLTAGDLEICTADTPPAQLDPSIVAGMLDEIRKPRKFQSGVSGAVRTNSPQGCVLVVEDNPDMNRFISSVLADHYEVVSAFDGEEGLAQALPINPTLIVSDIMMPKVSGVQMISRIRERTEFQDTPIIVLSAKADEELRIRLLENGAQDFIVKPFSEADLLVRVRNLVAARKDQDTLRERERTKRVAVEERNQQLRAQSEALSELFQQAPGFMAVLRGPSHVFELANAAYLRLIGHRDVLGKSFLEALPEMVDQDFPALLDRVFATGQPYVGSARRVLLQRKSGAPLEERYVDFVYQPLVALDGSVSAVFVEGSDVTERRAAEEALRQADRRKDEFLAMLAHELRNPLAPIRYAAKLAQNTATSSKQLKWSHDVIDRQVASRPSTADAIAEAD